ncbi:hypothetical protein F8M41_013641 [Gigaspora margarita]|uniref:Uncharacterized protein n=1 Tax=Gigaspora margarita TaxID=4874 RepID=A0A8H3WWH6_GIGMA|nr:hypothetical protein F8M41_013641 [Gigaspora margarita]
MNSIDSIIKIIRDKCIEGHKIIIQYRDLINNTPYIRCSISRFIFNIHFLDCRASDIIQTQKSIMKAFQKEHLYAATINKDFLSYYDSSDEIQYAMKDDFGLKTEKELNIITGDLIITYKMDKTSKLDKSDALQELKHVTRNNLLHELEADFKFYNYLT